MRRRVAGVAAALEGRAVAGARTDDDARTGRHRAGDGPKPSGSRFELRVTQLAATFLHRLRWDRATHFCGKAVAILLVLPGPDDGSLVISRGAP